MPAGVHARETPSSSLLVNISTALAHVNKELRQIRKKERLKTKLPHQLLTASKILFSRCGDRQLLLDFLKWKTAADQVEVNRWASEVTKWKELASQDDCKVYADGSATLTLRRAAVLLAKFTAERSLHSWVQQQNVTLGISPATAVVLQELPKHGLQGKARALPEARRKHRSSLQFLRRWRKRWGVRQGKIPIGEQLDSKELLLKVFT